MKKIKICVLGAHNHMHRLVNRDNIEFYDMYDVDPYNITIPQWGKEYTDFVTQVDPDYVICICIRCAAIACNEWIKTCKRPDRKFIMWNLDSYRHHDVKHDNADLYFYCLDDDVKRPGDIFLPVYAQPRPIIPLPQRAHRFGIINHNWGHFRDIELPRIENILKQHSKVQLEIRGSIAPDKYHRFISEFKVGLNLSTHYDGLPNYRTFEYAACGVYQICSDRNKNVLEKLLPYGISYYSNINEIPHILHNMPVYDPYKIREQVEKSHTLLNRIQSIMTYFGVTIPSIPEDGHIWTHEDYVQRYKKI
jgi:hypothetical protein